MSIRGWDQTGSNGANLSFPVALGIDDSAGAQNAERNSWIIGVINSAPYMAASLWFVNPPVLFGALVIDCVGAVGAHPPSIVVSAVVVPSLCQLSSVYSPSWALDLLKPGLSFWSAACFSDLAWAQKLQPFPFLLQKIHPLRFVERWL